MSAEDPNDVASWETFWVKVWRGHSVSLNGQEAIDYAKKDLSGICEPFRSALEWTPAGSSCYLDEMKYWLPSPWETHDGRVTLAGDAAHPMLPCKSDLVVRLQRGQPFGTNTITSPRPGTSACDH